MSDAERFAIVVALVLAGSALVGIRLTFHAWRDASANQQVARVSAAENIVAKRDRRREGVRLLLVSGMLPIALIIVLASVDWISSMIALSMIGLILAIETAGAVLAWAREWRDLQRIINESPNDDE